MERKAYSGNLFDVVHYPASEGIHVVYRGRYVGSGTLTLVDMLAAERQRVISEVASRESHGEKDKIRQEYRIIVDRLTANHLFDTLA